MLNSNEGINAMFTHNSNFNNIGGKKMNRKEMEKMLNWMLAMGIINAIQYSELWQKSLPYLKR